MLKAIIIDDEQEARDTLIKGLKVNCPDINIIDVCESGIAGVKSIRKHQPDVVFLDIDMPGMNGFEMLEMIENIDFEVIFTTAHDAYAVQAFRISAIGYLLKPISKKELTETVDRLVARRTESYFKQHFEALKHNLDHNNPKKRIAFPIQEGYEFIDSEEIIYCEADGSYTHVHLSTETKSRLYSRPLKEIEQLLAKYHFCRIHHSYVINLNHISKYIKGDGGSVKMSNKKELPVSRTRKHELLERIRS